MFGSENVAPAPQVHPVQIRGERMHAACVWSGSRQLRLFAPSRKTHKQAEADFGLLSKLAQVGPAGEEVAKKWRDGKCGNQEVSQALKKLAISVLKRPAGDRDGRVTMRRPSIKENVDDARIHGNEFGSAQRRFRVSRKRPYSFLFMCTEVRQQHRTAENAVGSSYVVPPIVDRSVPSDIMGSALVVNSVGSQDEHSNRATTRAPEKLEIVPMTSQDSDELVRTKIKGALLARLSEVPECGCEDGDIEKLALDISVQFKKQLENSVPQLRTVLFNLRDQRNPDFFRDIMSGNITPMQLPILSSEDMASASKRAERIALQEQHARESTLQRGASGAIDQNSLAAFKALRARR